MKAFSTFGVFLLLSAAALGQNPPTSYTIVQSAGNNGTMTIYRNGSKAAIETSIPANGSTPAGHGITLYDLSTGTSISWSVNSDQPACGSGRFSGDWGDPFAATADIKDAIAKGQLKPSGTETVAGLPAKIYSGTIEGTAVREWFDEKDGLLVKSAMAAPGSQPQVFSEITKVTFGTPPAAKLTPPAACAGLKPPPTPAELIADETGDSAGNYITAFVGPGAKNSCNVVLRVLQAKTMAPLTNVQVAIDTQYDQNDPNPPHYNFGVADSGRETFSGGHLHEITTGNHNGVVSLGTVPAYFNMVVNAVHPGHSGGPGLIYRQCFAPTTVLLFLYKNYGASDESVDALWVKAGKYATPPVN
ncbi:MAG TPA: hypothetical protein VMD29_04575 [Terracidiphilus sp.]|nr:hypothetical protein [Terracidiphilus sp.]